MSCMGRARPPCRDAEKQSNDLVVAVVSTVRKVLEKDLLVVKVRLGDDEVFQVAEVVVQEVVHPDD